MFMHVCWWYVMEGYLMLWYTIWLYNSMYRFGMNHVLLRASVCSHVDDHDTAYGEIQKLAWKTSKNTLEMGIGKSSFIDA